ncbi:hypothetical protein BH93_22970 [Rhodococcoides fascians A25f]|uniref:SIR2 family protein n=1 Tax=Rhodococcoides fascians TaxID=1828 RepID=UPI0013FDA9A3|nr:SIR2 family protein [Rhodococcus fascians]QII07857.1 hypothetical protein BH93_22970 [Rhodococcus fascians A25f]
MTIEDQLSDHLKKFSSGPILFVGSGVSQRYAGTPTWNTLLEQLSAQSGWPLQYYQTHVGTDPEDIAEMLASELHSKTWTPELKAWRDKNINDLVNSQSAVKIRARELVENSYKITTDPKMVDEMRLLKDCADNIDLVITTNYDFFLEEIFSNFVVYSSQNELIAAETAGVAEIYKIHGSLSSPNSIVLTKSDYDEFNKRNEYLIAKLLTLFAEHPIIFLGYSLGDRNVQSILRSLQNCLTEERVRDTLRDKLIFVSWDKTPGVAAMSPSVQVIGSTGIPIQLIQTSDFAPVFRAIKKVPSSLPKHIIRQVQERLYRIILDPSSQAKMLHVDDLMGVADHSSIYVGVGAMANVQQRGYLGVSRVEICRDCINVSSDLDYSSVVAMTFIQLLQNPGYFPMFKCLRGAGYLDVDGNIRKPKELPPKVVEKAQDPRRYSVNASSQKLFHSRASSFVSFTEMKESLDREDTLRLLLCLPQAKIDVEELRSFLDDSWSQCLGSDGKPSTDLVKAICFYDLLRYGPAHTIDV